MVTVRPMEPGDVTAVCALEQKIFSQPWSCQGFLDSLKQKNTVFLAAEEQGRIWGYLGMYISLNEGEITNVAVDPMERCRGIGNLLLEEIIREAKRRFVERIVLEVRISNDSAIRLYERNGFAICGIRKGFYDRPREDAYIMLYGQ